MCKFIAFCVLKSETFLLSNKIKNIDVLFDIHLHVKYNNRCSEA